MSDFGRPGPSSAGLGGDPSGGPAPDLGDNPAGGPADAGQRPAGSRSEPGAGPSPSSRSESNRGLQNSPSEAESGDANGESESTGWAAESAERFPAKPGREDESVSSPGDSEADVELAEDDPLTEVLAQRDEYRDALIRLQADFENYKKRMLKQQTEYLERAAGQLVDKLLPVLDTADLALAHGGGEDMKQVTGGLMSALEKEGLERIAGEGSPFDPTLHDAVVHEPGDDTGEQIVTEVLRAGYKWKGRVLRPAMVKVRG